MPNDRQEELLPCPFCGSENVHGHFIGRDFVECHDCGVTGSRHKYLTAAAAMVAWNTRPIQPGAEALREAFNCLDYYVKQLRAVAFDKTPVRDLCEAEAGFEWAKKQIEALATAQPPTVPIRLPDLEISGGVTREVPTVPPELRILPTVDMLTKRTTFAELVKPVSIKLNADQMADLEKRIAEPAKAHPRLVELMASQPTVPQGVEEHPLQKIMDAQKRLGPEFEKVLYDNLWELYETIPQPPIERNGAVDKYPNIPKKTQAIISMLLEAANLKDTHLYFSAFDEAFGGAVAEKCGPLVALLQEVHEHFELVDDTGQRTKYIHATEDPHVKYLCEQHGYGAVMDSAARQWFSKDSVGAFVIGSCAGLVRPLKAKVAATLATYNNGSK